MSANNRVWLVARPDSHGVAWLCGPCPGYTPGMFPLVFSYDINDAIQFVREQDAAELAAYLDDAPTEVVAHIL